jgi:DnaK suppressor protein
MKSNDLRRFKNRLLAMRARLRGDLVRMREEMFSEAPGQTRMPIHAADVAGQRYDEATDVQLMAAKEDIWSAIEKALESMEDGTYGNCVQCGRAIAKARLDAIPYAAECVECASR